MPSTSKLDLVDMTGERFVRVPLWERVKLAETLWNLPNVPDLVT